MWRVANGLDNAGVVTYFKQFFLTDQIFSAVEELIVLVAADGGGHAGDVRGRGDGKMRRTRA